VFEREGEAGAAYHALPEDLQASLPTAIKPFQRLPMRPWIATRRGNSVPDDRPPSRGRESLAKHTVVVTIHRQLGNLNKTFITLRENFGEVQDVLVAHDVRHHGRAVIV
jgi:hypothetical protein